MLLAAGIYEAQILGEDSDDCFFFICRAFGVHAECELGQRVIIRGKDKFPGNICPSAISGNAISLRVPGFPTGCFAVSSTPDPSACQPL